MIKFITHLLNVVRFMQLPKDHRILTFYSEGKKVILVPEINLPFSNQFYFPLRKPSRLISSRDLSPWPFEQRGICSRMVVWEFLSHLVVVRSFYHRLNPPVDLLVEEEPLACHECFVWVLTSLLASPSHPAPHIRRFGQPYA